MNYERIYLRPDSMAQSRAVIAVLQALVEHYAHHPELLDASHDPGSSAALATSVAWVAGMTDRYACRTAVELLDWPAHQLPQGLTGHP